MSLNSSWSSLIGKLWTTLTSLRLTVVLLLLLMAVSLVGTVRPRVFDSLWFLLPLGLFALNLFSCLVKGLPQAWRRASLGLTPAMARELPERARLVWNPNPDASRRLEEILRQEWRRLKKAAVDEQVIYFMERGRFRPLGPYVVHLALLLILSGGVLGKFRGLEGQLLLSEGETASSFQVAATERPLSFTVRLDRFQVLFYPDGTPREFRSDLTFKKDNGAPLAAVCRVNEPVTFEDLTFYQSSYGRTIRLRIKEGENSQTLVVPEGKTVALAQGKARFRVLDYHPDVVMPVAGQEKHYGPAVRLAYWTGDQDPWLLVVFKERPDLVERQPGPHRFFLEDSGFFSVLKVKRDPGVWWVYSGFLLLLPGLYLAFLRPRERWALVVEPLPEGLLRLHLKGAAPRTPEVFSRRLERLKAQLRQGGEAC